MILMFGMKHQMTDTALADLHVLVLLHCTAPNLCKGKSRNRMTFSKIENLRFLQNYDDYNCIFGIKSKGLSVSFI